MEDGIRLKPLELDALREAGNIGAGRAATALSQMLGTRVSITVPRAQVVRLERLPDPVGGPGALVAAVFFYVEGDLPGRLLLLLDEKALSTLLKLLTGSEFRGGQVIGEAEQSALRELGNILCSHYLNALSELMGVKLLPSVPALAYDMAASVLETVQADAAQESPQALMIENQFLEGTHPVSMNLFYLPAAGGLKAMLKSLAKATGVDPGA